MFFGACFRVEVCGFGSLGPGIWDWGFEVRGEELWVGVYVKTGSCMGPPQG